MPEFSVVIPSYNHAAYVGEAVRSVLEQSLDDLELIVVDDGSSDNSLEILAGFSDPRMRLLKQENRGAHAAINRGLHEASGNYLAILNSDDGYHPQRLEKILAALHSDRQVGLAGTYIEIVDAQGKRLGMKHGYHDAEPWLLPHPERSFRAGADLRAALLAENYLATTSNYVFSRTRFAQVGDFLPLRYTHDWDFALRVSKHARLALIEEPLLRYRVHGSNTIRENQAAMIFEILWILAVHLPQHTADPGWFQQAPAEARISQLLNSLYTFGLDRVLNVMLLQRLCEQPELSLALLDPQNPSRQTYLTYIEEQLAAQTATETAQPSAWKSLARRLLGRV